MQTRMMQIHMQKTAIDLYNQADPKADDIGRPETCKVRARSTYSVSKVVCFNIVML